MGERGVTTVDRHAKGYEPRFDIDAEVGRQGEMFCLDVQQAFVGGRVEVKRDTVAASTGRVFVEFECTPRGGYSRPSGIAVSEADVWAFVLAPGVMVVSSAAALKVVAREAYRDRASRKACTRGSHPTRGVVVPINQFLGRLIAADHGLGMAA